PPCFPRPSARRSTSLPRCRRSTARSAISSPAAAMVKSCYTRSTTAFSTSRSTSACWPRSKADSPSTQPAGPALSGPCAGPIAIGQAIQVKTKVAFSFFVRCDRFRERSRGLRHAACLAVFWFGFLLRPFGAIFFGHLGDLIGRKFSFMLTLLLMGAATFVVGLIPSYQSWGYAAPILILLMRAIQGLPLGGEYGGAA